MNGTLLGIVQYLESEDINSGGNLLIDIHLNGTVFTKRGNFGACVEHLGPYKCSRVYICSLIPYRIILVC